MQRFADEIAFGAGPSDFVGAASCNRGKARLHLPDEAPGGHMIDHTSLGVRDFAKAIAFYEACLRPLGYALQRTKPDEAAFGTEQHWGFFLYPVAAGKSVVGERTHVAFSASKRGAIDAFHRTAVENGARPVRPPGPRPDISPEYFGTVVVDPDGHTLEAVFWDRA
jgi:catechol 2,3-dioxygenase-like lactoylglutathione lyase family enzyme